jgi:hypothetical protein
MSARETLHLRLLAALEGLKTTAGVALVERNRVHDLPENARPALVLVDGDEGAPEPGRETRAGALQLVTMRVAVLGFVRAAGPSVGTELNTLLAATQSAIATDADLQREVGANGAVTFDGVDVDFAQGRQTEGGFLATWQVRYTFNPANP